MTDTPDRIPPRDDDDLPPISSFREIPGIPDLREDPEFAPRPRPPRPPQHTPKKVTLALAVLMALVAMLVGVALGYTARGGGDAPPLETIERDVPVVTVTPGE